jgi:hypothetical protein
MKFTVCKQTNSEVCLSVGILSFFVILRGEMSMAMVSKTIYSKAHR